MSAVAREVEVELPPKLVPVFAPPRGSVRTRGAYGGRGSGKSLNFAKMAGVFGYAEPLRIMVTRKHERSIKESIFAEIKHAIKTEPWLAANYSMGEGFCKGHNGTEFVVAGIQTAIKSIAQIDILIIEEAEEVPEKPLVNMLPTIRKPGSEVWVIWNPETEGSPVDKRYRQHTPDDAIIVEMNYTDNPWFTKELDSQRRSDREVLDDDEYAWVWEGAYRSNNKAQVLHGKYRVDEFVPGDDWHGPYYGSDWGFAQDPTTLIRMWITPDQKKLCIEYEAYGVGVDLDDTPALFNTVPGAKEHNIRADNARPETISFMRRRGYRMQAAAKGPGSVEDGIAHLRGFSEIVIHPRCKETIREARMWSYKKDKLTDDVLPVLVDAYNHCFDAVRYALEPIMKKRKTDIAGMKVSSL